MIRCSALIVAVLFSASVARLAIAQSTEVLVDSTNTVVTPPTTPLTYDTSYDRDVSTGTWTQVLSYSLTRGRVSMIANGTSTTVSYPRTPGLGGKNGTIMGTLTYRAAGKWYWFVNGTFNGVSSTDIVSETGQRQNRLKVSSQYIVSPWRSMGLVGVVSTEFQQDHGLTIRPLGTERVRLLTRYDAAGDSVGVDSVFVHDQRDSTYMNGRQDGANLQMTWRPRGWLNVVSSASGTRVDPVTTSSLRDFARALDGTQLEVSERGRFETPNSTANFDAKATFTGIRGLTAWTQVKGLHSRQGYFDKSLRDQEHLTIEQRNAYMHAEYLPRMGWLIGLDGTVGSSESGYTLRTSRSSLVNSQAVQSFVNFNPSIRSRGSLIFNLDHKRNERQQTGNGTNISRLLQANGAHQLSRRLSLDGAASVSLTSFQYVDSILDQDNARTYLSVGTGYAVSQRCSTTVHFSAARSHIVAIDASRSGDNNIQSTYQMDATMHLAVNSTLNINQNYLLNALYQIYDSSQSQRRNVLSRIRRIDTIVVDSVFRFATIQAAHNFLFRDSGSYVKPLNGDRREYNVISETYQQTFGVTLAVQPTTGIQMFVTQSLGNTRVHFPSTDARFVDNRWNLTFGATIERAFGGAVLRGSAQHIGAYSEQVKPGDPLNEQDDWIAGISLHKEL